jgi:hypothetical protein
MSGKRFSSAFIPKNLLSIGAIFVVLILYWVVLLIKIPYSVTQFFHSYSVVSFLLIFGIYYLAFRLPDRHSTLVVLGFTLLLFSLTLSYLWAAGYSDNSLIAGTLPYKDAKNFYLGATLISNGLPLENALQATERPLFPGFLSSVLLFTNRNLKLTLAILAQLAGIGLYFSARKVVTIFGPLAAALFSVLMYFYIQPWIGYLMSEIFGFALGCIAFVLLVSVADRHHWINIGLGLFVLLIAVSARAGAFIIFPLLVVWLGWVFREEKCFSMKAALYAAVIIAVGYVALNTFYPRLLGVPAGSSFGNFSYAIYGQVRGGTGWHSAIEDLGTRKADVVYRAAWEFFRAHPFSLVIAILKSYRDFFLPGLMSIFAFASSGQASWISYLLWGVVMALLFRGVFLLAKGFRDRLSLLLLLGFAGIFLSIPFLPPIDGGSRFYASTMPFFVVVPAVGISGLLPTQRLTVANKAVSNSYRWLVSILIVLTVVVPIILYSTKEKMTVEATACPNGQHFFAVEVQPMSFTDLVHNQYKDFHGQFSPTVSVNDFEKNNVELKIDDFYQELLSLAENQQIGIRIIPTINLADVDFHYFVQSLDKPIGSNKIISGCATEILTKNQSIYLINNKR